MFGLIRTVLSAFLAVLMLALPVAAFNTNARSAFVLDINTGTVLLNKDADTPLPPASMSKLMTLYVAFEALGDGRLTLDEQLPVSQHAMSYGGSTMFLDTTDRVRVEDLLRGIIVLSGNDACVVIAEALSPDGTEAGFARYMTQRAQKMGMTNSTFANSNGWPAAGHRMSTRDLALLATRLIKDFPQYYPLFSEREFAFDGRAPQNVHNRNPLLGLGIGADGLKTGHTSEAGYGLVGSAKQGDRRIVFVISGLDSAKARAEESEAIVNWAFRQFTLRPIATAGTVIAEADVWMGRAPRVGLTPAEDLYALMPVLGGDAVEAEVVFNSPIEAPIAKGQEIAKLILKPEGLDETAFPLVADRDIAAGGFVTRVKTAAITLLHRLQEGPQGS
ncbi:D-alanyl-D-alanine carboxypeptidase DacC precursor [Thalassovita gelatinovora]|uniref:serine-type D-Ala-D-Ala carboxypeptidase n=1 Tax=Thalassovita gelatinovora TaxID=53501 RepID=A0A0P1FK37_THAGE|nr:D-alanyl-D-alanine carboxypeptidase family protein [Thalassovita gelatinovora]QIZ82330.1 D-alanyl-D-alanine carboxypeptidase [Thalassovita gelatinovora]CUH68392.1 D-alanyl-D-alanine carboxypeptidase DacC precursor [Thalassovita gelatinovora]SER18905.1 D-alanyl-D-alanine carboxypeptidase (penicillin-binding protein 5/6) [Thalassovita gelatinovora]